MFKLRSLRIRVRLSLTFGAILVLLMTCVGIGAWRIQVLVETARTLGTLETEKLGLAYQWRAVVNNSWVRTLAAIRDNELSHTPLWEAEIDQSTAAIKPLMARFKELETSVAGIALLAELDTNRASYRAARADLFKHKKSGEDVSVALEKDVQPKALAFLAGFDRFIEFERASVAAALQTADRSAATAMIMLAAVGTVSLLLGALFAWALTRSIVLPLKSAASSARRIADGHLTESLDPSGRDEAADLIAAMADMQANLARIVGDVRQGSESVAIAAAEIAQGNSDLSSRTEQQASALQQTAASMEELGTAVKKNADNARQANQLALGASTVAIQGGAVVDQVVGTMKGINDSSRKIADIISVIDGIAFQTNILALNAAVEAARAGEQGRGFAVVAAEVRNLAQRSALAAKEIKTLISTSVERVEQGAVLVDRAGATMVEVVASIKRVTEIMGEISAASGQQSDGVTQVGEAVSQMDQATQQNAALVEESAAAAGSLKAQAQQLVQAVAIFKLGAQGAKPVAR